MSKVKHVMIREWIEDQIHRGTFVEGERLPTEQELMEQFGVSRAPVQQAMRALEHGGVVERRSGAGTFVSGAAIRSNLLNYLRPHRHEAQEHGVHKVLRTRVTAASEIQWCENIFSPSTPVALLDRVKLHTSGKPLVLERTAVNLTLAPAILDQDLEPLNTIPYYSTIGLQLSRVKTQITAELLDVNDASELELDSAVPVVCQHRTVYNDPDTVIESALYFTHPHHLTLEVTQNVSH
ncbi:MAG: GntR family transcriptional regulator [Yaniella sp.]|uniref:GntR family transcriptional regulator n=1 Tax=Yaniella sp. TaxID=2773929 RepID=UPI003F99870D